MSLQLVYGYKNTTYNIATGKISWGTPLSVISKGAILTPTSTDTLWRDDLGGQAEALSDDGIPLPEGTILTYIITNVAPVLTGEYHVKNIYDSSIIEDDTNIILYARNNGEVSFRNGVRFDIAEATESTSASYADSIRRTDQQIVDIVTSHGVTVSDYGTALAERIKTIIDKTMQNQSINDAKNKLMQEFNELGLDGAEKAKLESQFTLQLTESVIKSAMEIGSRSMLTQKQGELAERQKEGFNDNLLVKANESLGSVLGLTNSGTGNSLGAVVNDYSNTVKDLITRSKGQ